MTYMYQQAFTNFAFGYAAAMASLLCRHALRVQLGGDPRAASQDA